MPLILYFNRFYGNVNILILACLVSFEHLTQELSRYLISSNKILAFGILNFIKGAAWPVALMSPLVVAPLDLDLDLILKFWITGLAIAAIFGLFVIASLAKAGKIAVDWRWLAKAYKIAPAFLIATLLTRVVYVGDKLLIASSLGNKELGIYSFYFTVAMAFQLLLESLFVNKIFAESLQAERSGETFGALNTKANNLIKYIAALGVIGAIAGYPLVTVLVKLVGKSQVLDYLTVYWILMCWVVLHTAGAVKGSILYSIERDKLNIAITTFAALIALLTMTLASFGQYIWAFALCHLVAAAVSVVLKSYYCNKLANTHYRDGNQPRVVHRVVDQA